MNKMYKNIIIRIAIGMMVLSLFSNIVGAIPSEQWNKTIGGKNDDFISYGQQTSDGGYILIGKTSSYGNGDYDAWLVKTDSKGKEQWNKTFGGISYDDFKSGQQTRDGGYILGGSSGTNALLIKTDSSGKKLWSKTFNFSTASDPYSPSNSIFSVQQTSDDGYILGIDSLVGYWTSNYSIVKTDANGNKIWRKVLTYFKTRIDSVRQTSDGGYILVGDSYYGDSWLIKYDTNGKKMWEKSLNGKGAIFAHYGQQVPDEGYIVAGYCLYCGSSNYDTYVWIAKTDINGNQLWNITLEKGSALSIKPTSDGGYIIAGESNGNALIIKIDSSGKKQWSKTFGGANNVDDAGSGQQISDGYVLVGSTGSYGAGSSDAWLIKLYIPIGQAVDNTKLSWDSYGNNKWYGQEKIYYYDGDAARSGKISHNQYTTLRTYVPPGKVNFSWKVSSETGYDYLEFYVDSVLKSRISGNVNWQRKSYTITGSGTHTLRWRYIKNGAGSAGSDAGWVDYVVFKPATALYANINYGGMPKTFTNDTSFVGNDFNDNASSLKVNKI